MKKIIWVLSLLFMCGIANATSARVAYIVDGDTFVGDIILKDGTKINSVKIRLINVDTPELHGECEDEIKRAEYARQRLGELIPVGDIVEIKNVKNDKYVGRIDANVFDKSNRDVGKILVKEKVGRAYSGGKRQSWCK